ncbi:gamma-glutamyltransferase family protein [Pelagibacterium halotolerans]|uniref:Gamma-glutamyltranspeptidase n=1 Tax=Pelagibacterium halotolerans (strain DSM 22347 / JCM 15775 / CGMCC 1.7692 / B2) TaxID=1082931 RepID=G4RCE9_PELHB|nr:gamma-glutamyltransferase family protein [Pelagibacterium halotolerans]AEQ53743.1 gamma-glutamyltranspeptidase [Pelagibacterium halotolerans B2]QJR20095.1 gamma-glutamyltransferase family protein [Pelagibacterium halotolerans]SEA80041.1 gamma-glutamyltransferase 2. Threonine peptidase. MEROPS family T03 [Pelagibacterium halotolerans]
MNFTTRPELSGTFGMVASTHWIASATGMSILEKGGNAYDAAVATAFVLNVVEPHLNGPLGDLVGMIWPQGADTPIAVCGQGTAPAGATISHYRSEGLELVPGSGLLATVIPGAFDALMLILRDHGTMDLKDVLSPAIGYAENGHPLLPQVAGSIAGIAEFFRTEWPSSAAVWLPGGSVPKAGERFANPDLARTWTRLLSETASVADRIERIEAARACFYRGFIAEAIEDYLGQACVMDATGERRKGVLRADDMAGWEASFEPAISGSYGQWSLWKCGPWTQGPVLLQALNMLEGTGIATADPCGPDFVHTVTEALKLAFADREAYYGDPVHSDIPLSTLLSKDYAAQRRSLIGQTASLELRPGVIDGYESLARAAIARSGMAANGADGPGTGEPTMAHLTSRRGDTVHFDIVDRWGNMISATPSGGWLQSSPIIPGLGMPLNSRAQMFWLEEGLPTSLAPGRRPRTTLTPSMAQTPDGRRVAFGTPGGDQQDQWQLSFFLRLADHGMNLQESIDAPLFHTGHLQASFYPRRLKRGHLLVEPAFSTETITALRDKGHRIEVSAPWAAGRLTAVSREPDGIFKAAATPRLMQAYAIGR